MRSQKACECNAELLYVYMIHKRYQTNRGKVHRTQVHVRKSLATFAWSLSLMLADCLSVGFCARSFSRAAMLWMLSAGRRAQMLMHNVLVELARAASGIK